MVVPELDLVFVTLADADALAPPPAGLMLRQLVVPQVISAISS